MVSAPIVLIGTKVVIQLKIIIEGNTQGNFNFCLRACVVVVVNGEFRKVIASKIVSCA
jgi:hypothetical protein